MGNTSINTFLILNVLSLIILTLNIKSPSTIKLLISLVIITFFQGLSLICLGVYVSSQPQNDPTFKNCRKPKMENFISPLRFKKSNYVIQLFSNKYFSNFGQVVCLLHEFEHEAF